MELNQAIEIARKYAFEKYEILSYLKDRGYKRDYEEAKEIADAIFTLTKYLETECPKWRGGGQ